MTADTDKSSSSGPRRILVVDDEPVVREFVDRVLKGAGYATALAPDGPAAIGLAEQGRFDLLLTDEIMPQMTGHELARRLRIADPRLKVLYLTGYSDRLFAEKGGLWEDEAFLDKPCSVNGLRQAVSLLLEGHLSPDSNS